MEGKADGKVRDEYTIRIILHKLSLDIIGATTDYGKGGIEQSSFENICSIWEKKRTTEIQSLITTAVSRDRERILKEIEMLPVCDLASVQMARDEVLREVKEIINGREG